jgi:putative SOS response-associated peptidase YedK
MLEAEPLLDLLRPYPDDVMEAYPVSKRVNKPSDEPSCGARSLRNDRTSWVETRFVHEEHRT